MRICFLVNQLFLKDGWGNHSVSLIKHLAEKGIDCRVLSSVWSQENALPQIENYKVLPPLFVNRLIKLFFLIKNFFKIRKLIQGADLVHVLVEPYSPLADWAKQDKPLFITFHGTYAVDHFRKWYLRIIYRRAYQKAKKIICVSRFTEKETLKKISLKNTLVINNGVDYQKFQQMPIETIDKPSNKPMIISVGALMPRKGYHISIAAAAKVKEKYPDLKYYIIGSQKDKNYFNQLKALVSRNNLGNNVIFLENVSDQDLIKFYYQSDLFLLTPVRTASDKFEGFGLVYLEANACAKPVIGTYDCGAEDAVENGYNGFLVPPNDIEKTAEAILKILSNPQLAQQLGANGKKKAQEMDWQNQVKKYMEAYK